MIKHFGTYIIRHPITLKPLYVGKGTRFRPFIHLKEDCPNEHLRRRVAKLRRTGLEPIITYIDARDSDQAFAFEKLLIALYGRHDLGTGILSNHTPGGDGVRGYKPTAESNAVRSRALKGKPQSPELIAKRVAGMTGKKHSAERIRNNSRGHKQYWATAEARSKDLPTVLANLAKARAVLKGRAS